jgi:predicted SAM-dependent methyltransferase
VIETIEFKDKSYPLFQAKGNASQFAIPFAKHFCSGKGVDVGFHKQEWKYPGAIGADLNDESNEYHAGLLPEGLDYIYSSHCLEHISDWVATIEYWTSALKSGGVLFLYLPHREQEYWLPWNNRKHLHILDAEMVVSCMEKFGFQNIFSSDRDLNDSFMVVGEKA